LGQRLHYPLEVMLMCVRWYAGYPLSFRQIEEMMAERGVFVDHSTLHRWSMKIMPVRAAMFRRRKRPVGPKLANRRNLCQGRRPSGSTCRRTK
jgi:putative transposase